MTVLELLVLAAVLLELASRVIELFLMIKAALRSRKGPER